MLEEYNDYKLIPLTEEQIYNIDTILQGVSITPSVKKELYQVKYPFIHITPSGKIIKDEYLGGYVTKDCKLYNSFININSIVIGGSVKNSIIHNSVIINSCVEDSTVDNTVAEKAIFNNCNDIKYSYCKNATLFRIHADKSNIENITVTKTYDCLSQKYIIMSNISGKITFEGDVDIRYSNLTTSSDLCFCNDISLQFCTIELKNKKQYGDFDNETIPNVCDKFLYLYNENIQNLDTVAYYNDYIITKKYLYEKQTGCDVKQFDIYDIINNNEFDEIDKNIIKTIHDKIKNK